MLFILLVPDLLYELLLNICLECGLNIARLNLNILYVFSRFADDYGLPLFETSAKDDSKADHVEAIFMTLAHKIHQSKQMLTSEPLSSSGSEANPAETTPVRRIVYRNDSYSGESEMCCY